MNVVEYEKLIWPVKRPCQVFGCWPYSVNRFFRMCVLAILITNVVGCSSEISLLLAGDDMNATIEAALVTSAFYMTVFRFLVFSYHRRNMLYVLNLMRRDWTSADEQDTRLLADKTMDAFKLSKLFTLNVLFAGSAFAVMPALEVLHILLKSVVLPINEKKKYY